MSSTRLVSVIVNNYNYGRFLRDAIESALNQTYPNTEVIVVDDGSTDDSREIIAEYGDTIVPVLKDNGGQGSACNAGFAVSHGDPVFFLDADDKLLPEAIQVVVESVQRHGTSKVHFPLFEIDHAGEFTGAVIPTQELVDGDLRSVIMDQGPHGYLSPPTSGNAWSRNFLNRVLPIPEQEFHTGADAYLATLAPLFGPVGSIDRPVGCYRVHDANDFAGRSTMEQNLKNLSFYRNRCKCLSRHLARQGILLDETVWECNNAHFTWMLALDEAARVLMGIVPEGGTFIIVDEAEFANSRGVSNVIPARQAVPFPERNGQYNGRPSSSREAILELERLGPAHADYLVFAWPAFWWLEYYTEFREYLDSNYDRLLESGHLVVYGLNVRGRRL